MKIYVPCDAAAVSVGADAVARAIEQQIASSPNRCAGGSQRIARVVLAGAAGGSGDAGRPRGLRSGSRGICGRRCLTQAFTKGGPHALCLGLTEEIPYLKQQERLTFARCGITDPLSLGGLHRARRLSRAWNGR